MADFHQSLMQYADYLWGRTTGRLAGLTDEEYLWEPGPGAWSVRPTGDGFARERPKPEPTPPPLKTIAWLTWHLGSEAIDGLGGRTFGYERELADRAAWYGTADEALAAMDRQWTRLRAAVAALGEDGVRRLLGPGFGPYAKDCLGDMVLHVLDEIAHHGAELGMLRDLYAISGTPRSR